MPFIAMLMALVAPIAKRVLVSLGFGLVIYAGFTEFLGLVENAVSTNLGQTSTAVLQIISLYGMPQATGIIIGAFAVNVSLMTLKRFALL